MYLVNVGKSARLLPDMDASVLAALISASGSIIAAVIAATCAAMIGKKFADRKRLQDRLLTAAHDIEFLLEVERKLLDKVGGCEGCGQSTKLEIRKLVRDHGYTWSEQYTDSRIRRLAERLA